MLKYRVSVSPLAEFVSLILALNFRFGRNELYAVVLMTKAPSDPIAPVEVKLVIKLYDVPLSVIEPPDQSTHESPFPSSFKLRVVVCGQTELSAPLKTGEKVVATDPNPT